MAEAERSRLALTALGFGVAAALSCWNPLSAPFGLVVGLASLVLAVRAFGRGAPRPLSVGALVLSAGAVVASALVLALTAGVGRELGGMPIVPVPARGEVNAELDAGAERTRPARERARSELDSLGGTQGGGTGGREEGPKEEQR